jgi:hypothetical protein
MRCSGSYRFWTTFYIPLLEDAKAENKWKLCGYTWSRADGRIVVLCNADDYPMWREKKKCTTSFDKATG